MELHMIEKLNMSSVKQHYDERIRCHQRLLSLLNDNRVEEYLNLALGVSEPCGNYSASEHHLGDPILANNSHHSIVALARSFLNEDSPRRMLISIQNANLSYLKISVGSEMAMMLKPNIFWVGNVRTIWTHLLCKHQYNLDSANEELKLYKEQNTQSQMYYPTWSAIYQSMNAKPSSIDSVCKTANEVALIQNVEYGSLKYMWFDAIASSLYDSFADT
jgi:hypothetical protein